MHVIYDCQFETTCPNDTHNSNYLPRACIRAKQRKSVTPLPQPGTTAMGCLSLAGRLLRIKKTPVQKQAGLIWFKSWDRAARPTGVAW